MAGKEGDGEGLMGRVLGRDRVQSMRVRSDSAHRRKLTMAGMRMATCEVQRGPGS